MPLVKGEVIHRIPFLLCQDPIVVQLFNFEFKMTFTILVAWASWGARHGQLYMETGGSRQKGVLLGKKGEVPGKKDETHQNFHI